MGADFTIPLFELLNLLFILFRQRLAVSDELITAFFASNCIGRFQLVGLTRIGRSSISDSAVGK
jgi:hypothetical protein